MARFRFVERGLLPWIVMSQTVPLIALAPQVVSWSGKIDLFGWEWPRWLSVCTLAAFLAFFPISVGTLRGLSSTPPAAMELMQSYAASWRRTLFKLRFPAAVPSMVPAFKLAATLSVVGVIVSEISTGVSGGIGRAVISYSQAATGDPTKVYAAVFGAAAMGLLLYGVVVVADLTLMRNRPQESEG
jgi:NitT/TauT family transport system permease protein